MAKVKIQGHASGTGVLTVTAPNTSTDRTITLPDSTGTLLTADGDGSSLTGVGVAGISSSADATAMTITSAEKIGIGTTSPNGTLHINSTANTNATTTYITRGDGTNNLPASIDTQTSLLLANSSDTYSNYLSIQSAPVGTSGINFGDSADENIGQIGYFNNGDTMRFKVGATEKMRLTSDGLTFNGDTAAANALDDYEEGTWTIAFQGATFSGGNRTGYYVKVGNLVHATVYCGGITISNVSGAGTCSGVPYSMASLANHYAVGSYVHGNAVTGIQNFYLDYTNNTMYPTATDTTSTASWVAGSNKHLMISVTYRTS